MHRCLQNKSKILCADKPAEALLYQAMTELGLSARTQQGSQSSAHNRRSGRE